MRFNMDAKVCLQVDKTFADGRTITAGSSGSICDIYQIFNAYLVKFNGVGMPRMISDDELELC